MAERDAKYYGEQREKQEYSKLVDAKLEKRTKVADEEWAKSWQRQP